MFQQFKYLILDLKRLNCAGLKGFFYLIFEQAVWAIIFYRMGRALFLIKIPLIKTFFRIFAFFLFKFSEILFGVSLSPSTEVGPGLYIGHTGLIVIHHEVVIGKNLNIAHGVTIGTKGVGYKGTPVIADDVFVGAGAKILGPIKIGNNVKIGANAVVITDIPDNSTAVGIPAKVIK